MLMLYMIIACVGIVYDVMAYRVYIVMDYIFMAHIAEHAAHRWLTSRAIRRHDLGNPQSWHLCSYGPTELWPVQPSPV